MTAVIVCIIYFFVIMTIAILWKLFKTATGMLNYDDYWIYNEYLKELVDDEREMVPMTYEEFLKISNLESENFSLEIPPEALEHANRYFKIFYKGKIVFFDLKEYKKMVTHFKKTGEIEENKKRIKKKYEEYYNKTKLIEGVKEDIENVKDDINECFEQSNIIMEEVKQNGCH